MHITYKPTQEDMHRRRLCRKIWSQYWLVICCVIKSMFRMHPGLHHVHHVLLSQWDMVTPFEINRSHMCESRTWHKHFCCRNVPVQWVSCSGCSLLHLLSQCKADWGCFLLHFCKVCLWLWIVDTCLMKKLSLESSWSHFLCRYYITAIDSSNMFNLVW